MVLRLTVLLAGFAISISSAFAQPVGQGAERSIRGQQRPRLVVVISIDQFRADYLTRLGDLLLPAEGEGGLPGGFNWLTTRGAWFVDARYEHTPLFTGPGHAVIMTGAHPYKSGIISNDWWDRSTRKHVYCVDDAKSAVVGASQQSKAKPMSAALLRSSTVGDELKLATGGAAKVITLALKDRAAILLGGHAQDVSIWYDATDGRWISSSAYCRDGKLPAWVAAVNDEHIPDRMLGQKWVPLLGDEIMSMRSAPTRAVGEDLPEGMGASFPHTVGAEKSRANYRAFAFTPAANKFVFDTAARAVADEKLGQDDIPDILAINLSTNDYIGHCWGPYSPESLDVTVRTDRQLAEFLAVLAKAVPGGLDRVMVVLTADHGVAPVPEDASEPPNSISAGRFNAAAVLNTISGALGVRFGEIEGKPWLGVDIVKEGVESAFMDGFIYFNPDAVSAAIAGGRVTSVRELETVACDAVNAARIQGVYACYGRTQILEGRIADTDLTRHLSKGVHPVLSSDLFVTPEPFWLQEPMSDGHATSHGTPYVYDTHVPVIVCAPGILRPGVYADPVSPADIAPTISLVLGVEFPSGCDGRPLLSALRSEK